MRTLVVIPTYFEVETIEDVVRGIREAVSDAHLVVVDDGSTDGTIEVVQRLVNEVVDLSLVQRTSKTGLGDAYLHIFRDHLNDYELFVEIDADLSHDPSALPELLSAARAGADVVIGSRYVPGGRIEGWQRSRVRLSRWGNRYASLVLGLAVNDATSGLRVYRTSLLHRIGLNGVRSSGYGFQVEMTYRAVKHQARVVEIPITFRERTAGTSKMNRSIVWEAFGLITAWGIRDVILRRRIGRMRRDTA